MSQTLPISIQMSALPPQVKWTIQQLADAMVARMSLVTSQTFALFVTGSTAPTSDVGPWLKNGTEWWVWSNTAGAYVPIDINQESLGYYIGSVAPDETVYQFWIQTAVSGSPLALKIYYGAAWVDVYAALLASYQTVAAMSAYYTSAQTDSAIAAAVGAIPSSNSYVGVATLNVAQSVPVDTAYHQMTLDTKQIDDSTAINLVAGTYTAPANGDYQMTCTAQFDNDTGTASGMQVICTLYKNGTAASEGIGNFDATPSPNGSRWHVNFTGIIRLATNDTISVWAALEDGVNTGAVDLNTWDFSIHKVG